VEFGVMTKEIRLLNLWGGFWRLEVVVILLIVLQRLEPKMSGGDLVVYPLNKPVVGVAAQLRSGGDAHGLLLG
jgi:hypothetical protein